MNDVVLESTVLKMLNGLLLSFAGHEPSPSSGVDRARLYETCAHATKDTMSLGWTCSTGGVATGNTQDLRMYRNLVTGKLRWFLRKVGPGLHLYNFNVFAYDDAIGDSHSNGCQPS